MTRIQKEVLDIIKEYWAKNGYCPSYDEIGLILGVSSRSNVHRVVKALADRGFIERRPGKSRSIVVVNRPIAGHVEHIV